MAKKRNIAWRLGAGLFFALFRPVFMVSVFVAVVLQVWVLPRRPDRLVWGPDAVLNNKYFSAAMSRAGWKSETLMNAYAANINKKEDYDRYFGDFLPKPLRGGKFERYCGPYLALLFVLSRAKVFHIPFTGGVLNRTRLWRLEGWLLRRAKIPTVVMSYGRDHFRYSTVADTSLRHGLLTSQYRSSRRESEIARRVEYWNRHGDAILLGSMLDGAGRWDVTLPSFVVIDTDKWDAKKAYSMADGRDGTVRVVHAPNHRGFKGTEFVLAAVERLRNQGLRVELSLLENVKNDEVREIMRESDILAEQLLCYGFGLNGIEGMAVGLPILCNLENDNYANLFRRFSFLGECPAVSCSVESFEKNLRTLILSPDLREALGRAGSAYVRKYHSYEMAQYLFGSIYENILDNRGVDLVNLFHPLKSDFNARSPIVDHPLENNAIPERYLETASDFGNVAVHDTLRETASGL